MILHSSVADYNAKEYEQKKLLHSENEIRSSCHMRSNKDQGEVGTGHSPKGVSGKWKRGRSANKHKKEKRLNKNKHSKNKRSYRSILHPRQQKRLLLLLKDINLEENSASISTVHFLFLLYYRHLLAQSLQRQEVKKGCWVADSMLYLMKISSNAISPLTWPNMPKHILKLM